MRCVARPSYFETALVYRSLSSMKVHAEAYGCGCAQVAKGQTLPKDHPMIPSLLQLLCMAISARHAYDASSHDKVRHSHYVLGDKHLSITCIRLRRRDKARTPMPHDSKSPLPHTSPVLQDFCIPSAEDAEGVVGFMLRHLMPCYLELAGFNKLMNK